MAKGYIIVDRLLQIKSIPELAYEVGVASSSVHRWSKQEAEPNQLHYAKLEQLLMQYNPQTEYRGLFTFIDLFAGIGGIRRAFQDVGGRCVFTSEWDEYAQKTYSINYPQDKEPIWGDITEIKTDMITNIIPKHDVLLAGFPCQPFSIAGVSKKNSLGRVHGFLDETQGTLFFDVARIINVRRPKVFVLENVKNLKSHDHGRTLPIIMSTLRGMKYHVEERIIDGQHFVPQHRERIIIVGVRDESHIEWNRLELPPKGLNTLDAILHKPGETNYLKNLDGDHYYDDKTNMVNSRYTLSDKLWEYLQNYAAKHKLKGNGFGYGLVTGNSIARTLSARYYKDGSEILVAQDGENPRRLTPRECARLMGFPDEFMIPVSDTRAYKQFGNSVVVPVFHAVAEMLLPAITREEDSALLERFA